jgi:hypothetical protein
MTVREQFDEEAKKIWCDHIVWSVPAPGNPARWIYPSIVWAVSAEGWETCPVKGCGKQRPGGN